MSQLQLVR